MSELKSDCPIAEKHIWFREAGCTECGTCGVKLRFGFVSLLGLRVAWLRREHARLIRKVDALEAIRAWVVDSGLSVNPNPSKALALALNSYAAAIAPHRDDLIPPRFCPFCPPPNGPVCFNFGTVEMHPESGPPPVTCPYCQKTMAYADLALTPPRRGEGALKNRDCPDCNTLRGIVCKVHCP